MTGAPLQDNSSRIGLSSHDGKDKAAWQQVQGRHGFNPSADWAIPTQIAGTRFLLECSA